VPRRQPQDPARPLERGLFRVLEGFPDLAHDDEADACSGALDMLNLPMNSRGIYELYRRQAEQLKQRSSSWFAFVRRVALEPCRHTRVGI